MTLPWSFRGNDRFPGLWVNEVGYVLFIEKQPGSDILLVSFSPSKEFDPIQRPYGDKKASVRMPARCTDDYDALVVRLADPQKEPSLHLTPEAEAGFYYDGPCLVPAISSYASQYESEEPDLSWLEHLEPYQLVEADEEIAEFQLVRYIRNLNS